MSVETLVAEHGAQLKAHAGQHGEHKAEFATVWGEIKDLRKAGEERHRQVEKLSVTVDSMADRLAGLDDFIRGDMRKAVIGLVSALVVLAALVVLTLTGDVQSVHDAAASALPGGP